MALGQSEDQVTLQRAVTADGFQPASTAFSVLKGRLVDSICNTYSKSLLYFHSVTQINMARYCISINTLFLGKNFQ